MNTPKATTSPTAQFKDPILYTVYQSSMRNHGIIMKSGKVLHVINSEYITADEEEIAFLDKEIASGFPFMQKVDKVTLESRDPMKVLRDKIIAEYEAKKAAEAAEETVPVIGDSDTGSAVAKHLSPGSTAALKRLAAGSGV